MASGSSAPTFIANLTIFEVKDRLRPIFKEVPLIAKKEDSTGAFSKIPDGMMYVEDVRAYIHCILEDLGIKGIKSLYQSMILGSSGTIKPKYKEIEDLGLFGILYILEFKDEVIRYILSRFHNEFMWLDRPYMITKEAIKKSLTYPKLDKNLARKFPTLRLRNSLVQLLIADQ